MRIILWPEVVLLMNLVTSSPQELNVAVYKPGVYQTDVIDGNSQASKAVDNKLLSGANDHCAVTAKQTGHMWWMVDLRIVYEIKKVKLYLRSTYQEKNKNMSIWTSTAHYSGSGEPDWNKFEMCANHPDQMPVVTEMLCHTTARYVAVRKYNFLHLRLCEVQILIQDYQSPLEENKAQGKPTWQINNQYSSGGQSQKAVDGNTDGNYFNGHCTHTLSGSNRWWLVNLQEDIPVTRVRVYNRIDNQNAQRLINPEVWIAPQGSYSGSGTPDWSKFTKCGGFIGQFEIVRDMWCGQISHYVAIRVSASTHLHMCEVQVFAKKSVSIQSESFFYERNNHIGNSTTIAVTQVKSEAECGLTCAHHTYCNSYTLKINNQKQECHMYLQPDGENRIVHQ